MPKLLQRLESRLESLPDGLQAHIYRVRDVALELAGRHAIDLESAELGALAHDICRAVPNGDLLSMSAEFGMDVSEVEQDFPVLLHGPVGAELLRREEDLTDSDLYEAVHWHSTAHATLAPLGKLIFLADKLDPQKITAYPFLPELRRMALKDLDRAVLLFLSKETEAMAAKGWMIHPKVTETRNHLLAVFNNEG